MLIHPAENAPRDPDHEEIAKVARHLWLDRGGRGGSAEEDWFRAADIVRRRRAGDPGANGNGSGPGESYVADTAAEAAVVQPAWKEPKHMNNMSGTMENTGSEMNAGNMMDRAREAAENVMQNEPQSFPRPEHREGRLARTIEQQTAKIPSDAWLWAAVGSMGLSLALELSGKEKTANFVGHWVPTLLIFGLYNKLVKLQGSDGL